MENRHQPSDPPTEVLDALARKYGLREPDDLRWFRNEVAHLARWYMLDTGEPARGQPSEDSRKLRRAGKHIRRALSALNVNIDGDLVPSPKTESLARGAARLFGTGDNVLASAIRADDAWRARPCGESKVLAAVAMMHLTVRLTEIAATSPTGAAPSEQMRSFRGASQRIRGVLRALGVDTDGDLPLTQAVERLYRAAERLDTENDRNAAATWITAATSPNEAGDNIVRAVTRALADTERVIVNALAEIAEESASGQGGIRNPGNRAGKDLFIGIVELREQMRCKIGKPGRFRWSTYPPGHELAGRHHGPDLRFTAELWRLITGYELSAEAIQRRATRIKMRRQNRR